MKETITLYLNKKDASLLRKQARTAHLSLTSYIRSISLQQAKEDLSNIKLNDKDWDLLLSELNNPNEPNKELIKLFNK